MTQIDLRQLQQWEGRTETLERCIEPHIAAQMAGSLGHDVAPGRGEELPLPWYWLYFTPAPHARNTGVDGHMARGGFLPPVPLPRRMWAGSRVICHRNLRVGDVARRSSRVEQVAMKDGRSGQLVFVTVTHDIYDDSGELMISESQDIVYREATTTPTSTASNVNPEPYKAPVEVAWSETVDPDPVLLFRYSALSFNSHRIHYDRDYALNSEGYPGLVVQGPLTATLLLDMLYRAKGVGVIKSFSFRGANPLFDGASFKLEGGVDGQTARLWALTPAGQLAMSLDAEVDNVRPYGPGEQASQMHNFQAERS